MRLVFIVGCPHSGTNWVNDWLCQHPDIIGHPETYFLTHLIEAFRSLHNKGWNAKFKDELLRRTFLEGIGDGKVILMFDDNLINYSSELDRIFPGAHYLLFHRDGRRVAASLKNRVPQLRGKQLTKRWCRHMKIILDKKLPHNCFVMRYDQIGTSSRKITQFIDVEHHGDITDKKVNCSFGELKSEDFWQDFLSEKDQEHFIDLQDLLIRSGY